MASVIIPTHRGAHRLPPLLEALAEQDVADPWEVVVALDGVLDETVDVLRAYDSRLPLRTLHSESPRGLCATLNDAYDAAHGVVLIRCDDDLSPASDMVRRHVAWHEYTARPVGVIGVTCDVFAETPYARSYGRPANLRQRAAAYTRDPEHRWIHWAAHNSVTRESWRLVGGFDPRFTYREDSELGLRLYESGVSIVIDPALEIGHRGPATSAHARASRAFVSGSSRRLFVAVHPTRSHAGPEPTGLLGRLWNAGTASVAAIVRSPEGFGRIGALADRLPDSVPDAVRSRLIAFAVESADRSGYRHRSEDADEFRHLKGAEVATERATNAPHRAPPA